MGNTDRGLERFAAMAGTSITLGIDKYESPDMHAAVIAIKLRNTLSLKRGQWEPEI
jgi:hypothetical protein